VNKPGILLETNPNGTVPAMIVTRGEKELRLYESLEAVEVFDDIGTGAHLFPRGSDGVVDPFIRAVMRNRIAKHTGMAVRFYTWYENMTEKQTPEYT
jgi:glutathione S-transferase